jgi:CRP-like cAMP-binding protein
MVPISQRSPNADLVDRVVSRDRLSSHPSSMARSLERLEVIARAFPHSRADTRRTLERSGAIRTFRAGQAIVHQGDESDLALVLDGHVAIRRTTVSGRQLIVRIVTRGGLAGILTLTGRPASGDAIALSPSVAVVWSGEDVRSAAGTDSGLAVDILDHVLATFEQTVERLDGMLYQSALRRVARMLHDHADLFFAEGPVLTRSHLPMLVGTSREMTGRVLRALEARQLVARVGRHRLDLLDPVGLAEAAETESIGPDLSAAPTTRPSSAA